MKVLYSKFKQANGVSIDTRSIKGGELFFCLRGDNFNGNKFAQQALDSGAFLVIVDDSDYFIENTKMLLVENSLKSLQELAKYHRKQLKIPVIGITGTNGKTTSKELITAILSTHYRVLATQGNFNNHIGVPLTLLQINNQHEIAVIEMGANHMGEIEDLCLLSQPNFGLISNIGKAHLEGFGSFENIIQTKTALYRSVIDNSGILFVNADDKLLVEKAPKEKIEKYSSITKTKVRVKPIKSDRYLQFYWDEHLIKTQLFGDYNLYNAAAAISVGKYFDVPNAKIISALEKYSPSNNRSQLEIGKNNQLILDAYNANPDSMDHAINSFNQALFNNKAVILGDMLELGSFAHNEHLALLQKLNTLNFDKVYLVGPGFYALKNDFTHFSFFKNNLEALDFFTLNPLKAYRILLKGSRGIKLEILKEQLL